jgi:hypothetical protein
VLVGHRLLGSGPVGLQQGGLHGGRHGIAPSLPRLPVVRACRHDRGSLRHRSECSPTGGWAHRSSGRSAPADRSACGWLERVNVEGGPRWRTSETSGRRSKGRRTP